MEDVKKTYSSTAEVWVEEGNEGKVYIKPFRGKVLEVDLSRFRFRSAQEAAEFTAKLIDRAGWDNLSLANLNPVTRHVGGVS